MTLDRSASILITGSAGRLGRSAVSGLVQAGWQVRGFDRVPTPGTKDFVVGDLTDAAAIAKYYTRPGSLLSFRVTGADPATVRAIAVQVFPSICAAMVLRPAPAVSMDVTFADHG